MKEDYSLAFEESSCAVYSEITKLSLLFKVPMSKSNVFPFQVDGDQHAFKASLANEN